VDIYLIMHCYSYYRHPSITPVNMSDLTLGDVHLDDRYLHKTLPTMQTHGMIYPLLCWLMQRDFYENKFLKITPDWMLPRLPQPSYVWQDWLILVKGGNNRYQAARDLGYTSIDCMIFDEQLDAIKWTVYLNQADPLKNPNIHYQGTMNYK